MTRVTDSSMPPMVSRKEYGPGDVIGEKYRLVQLLGEGGMGSVWVAENVALKANFALKLIRADIAESSANERFLSEARLAARLQHVAIVRVFDFGKTENEEAYIVMELLEGETLGQRLSRLGSIDPVELCQMLLPIVDALHSAHGHGVIHRDLKPDNVFITKTDGGVQPKLLDFGIAKLRGESAFVTTKLTQAGTLIGSPDYMSPEQARGETDLDPRSDVWALCVLAYECLVGKPPFHGDNYNALLWAIIHDEPVPITVFQAGDAELWRILKTGFAKDRNARWASAKKLGEAIALWLESHGIVEDICNRSLQSSWLPAERPTRPELAPFDPAAPSPRQSHSTLAPQATLPMLRRPHTMSLWFAALGLTTLVGAYMFANSGESRGVEGARAPVDTVDKQVNSNFPAEMDKHANPNAVPGQLPITDSLGAAERARPELNANASLPPSEARVDSKSEALKPEGVNPAGLKRPAALGAAPIGSAVEAAAAKPSSWTENHERPLQAKDKDALLAEEFSAKVSQKGRDDKSKHAASKPSTKDSAGHDAASASPAPRGTPTAKTDPAAKAAARSPRKKAADGKPEQDPYDFGI